MRFTQESSSQIKRLRKKRASKLIKKSQTSTFSPTNLKTNKFKMALCNFLRRIHAQLQFHDNKPQKPSKFLNLLIRLLLHECLQPWNWDRSTIRLKGAKRCNNPYSYANLTTTLKTMNSLLILIRMIDRKWRLASKLAGRCQQPSLWAPPPKLSSIRPKTINLMWMMWDFPVTRSSKNKSWWDLIEIRAFEKVNPS